MLMVILCVIPTWVYTNWISQVFFAYASQLNAIQEMHGLFSIWCDLKFDITMYRKELVKNWGSSHLPCCGWYRDYLPDYIPILERLEWK
jgi:hypothetical protein